jgi:hypothetical protein
MLVTIAVFASGTVATISRCHLRTRCGGQEDEHAVEPGEVRGRGGDRRLAGSHLADEVGASMTA